MTDGTRGGKRAQLILNVTALLFIIAIFSFVTVKFLGFCGGSEEFVEYIRQRGIGGALVLIAVQTLQVVVAFIPGEVVELAAGVMYGPWIGLILCLIGLNVGTVLIFCLVKWFGKAFVKDRMKGKELPFSGIANDERRLLVIMFFLLMIPGIPKDILIYAVPLTSVRMHRFMIVSTIARIPTVITSTFTGAAVIEKNFTLAIILTALSLILATLGIIFNKKICTLIDRAFPKKSESEK